MIKVDLQKASDSIQWSFVDQLLKMLGFPPHFVKLVVTCLTAVSYQICLNGELTPPFSGGKGLRQGDRVSPFLFVLCMEYLSRCLTSLQHQGGFRYHPQCGALKITHLVFADDLMFFSKGNLSSVSALLDMFDRFSRTSGLIANKRKSEIYFAGVRPAVQVAIQRYSGLQIGSLPFRNLSIPLSAKRLYILQYQLLLEKMLSKVHH